MKKKYFVDDICIEVVENENDFRPLFIDLLNENTIKTILILNKEALPTDNKFFEQILKTTDKKIIEL